MSWASHYSELWDEICKKGIFSQIILELKEYGYEYEGHTNGTKLIEAIVDVLCESYDVKGLLTVWASKAVNEAVGDHFTSIGDALRVEKEREGP